MHLNKQLFTRIYLEKNNQKITKLLTMVYYFQQITLPLQNFSYLIKKNIVQSLFLINKHQNLQMKTQIKFQKSTSSLLSCKQPKQTYQQAYTYKLLFKTKCFFQLNFSKQDRTMRKLIEINEIFFSIFEAMPMAVLQFINNYMLNQWTKSDGSLNWFIILSFVSSAGSVLYNIFILSHWMFDSEIKSFFDLLTCMMDSQKGRKEEKVKKVFSFFDIPQKVLITSQSQLQKMALLKPDRFSRIKQLHIHLPKNKNSFDILLIDMHTILQNLINQKIKLACFSLNLSECNMTSEQRYELTQQVRKIKAESKYLNLRQTTGEAQCNLCDSIVERALNMSINSNFFYFAEDFTLYRVCKLQKMNEIDNFLNLHKIKMLKLEEAIFKSKFYVNIQEEQQYSPQCLNDLLAEKEESIVQIQIKLSGSTQNYNFIDGYTLKFPLYLDQFFYLQVNSPDQINFSSLTNILLNNLKQNSYSNGVIVNANFQFNQSASLVDILKYFMSLYKFEQKCEDQNYLVEDEIFSKNLIDYEDQELISPNQQENDMVIIECNQSIYNQTQPPKVSVLQSMMVKEDAINQMGVSNLNNQILFQIIKIDDCILIGCSKALFNQEDFLSYLISEEGNYSCLFLFLDFEIPQEFLLKLQAQLQEYFRQMNNLRHLHLIIGESGSFYIDLQLHFTFIENVMIYQNELFQFKFTDHKTEKDSLQSTKQVNIYTYADLVSDDIDKHINSICNNEYAQQVLINAKKGLNANKNLIQKDLENILSQNNLDYEEQVDNKFQTRSFSFNSVQVCLPLELPPLSAKLLPQALKQMNMIQKISIYDNIGIDIQDFIQQNSQSLQYLKVLNSKIERCNCGLKHQSKTQQEQKNLCGSSQKMMTISRIIYRINTIQIIDIEMLKVLKYLNITQSQMYLSSDYQHFVNSLQSLSSKLQVVKLGFQSCNIWFNSSITDFLCNSFILQTFQINAVSSYKLIGLDCILKGLSFNFLISNIGIKINSNQITQKDMDLIDELLQKRKAKGSLKSFKFSLKKSIKTSSNNSLNNKQYLDFYNKMMCNLMQIIGINKISLSFKNFNANINQVDLPYLSPLLFQKNYKTMKININGNTNQYILSQQILQQFQQEAKKDQQEFNCLSFKSDYIGKQIARNNIFEAVFNLDTKKKILTIPYDILDNKQQNTLIKGQYIFLKIESDLNLDLISMISFENSLSQLILDFSQNIYLLFEDILNLMNKLVKENQNIKYLCIKKPNQLLSSSQIYQIKQLFKSFQHFQPKKFLLN
ncbi:transmembrane protein, putative (macronuclear) [Tetrahymena thermophila SB210]|uniref:Transmembrane protein, putative n=1 Tax=Tetrahymena thermophila (strain SB210) TaxID=312017 RepID=I7MKK7_TETTS|nr:transmembrane protein, putative [Tetrahymena thermophila SB210]EAR99468.2 transmembrane protein, putative [Tetrahymena thermophila SB210]|eukprot:XP_001019713.2 transmembrane protein, putative [Tetrahymena thermophila SB210]